MAAKCKRDDRVRARASGGAGDPVGVWGCVRLPVGGCTNDRGYIGPLFVLTRRGRQGMQMFPSLAEVLPGQLRTAAAGGQSVRIEHKVLGVWSPKAYAILDFAAARSLADAIDAALQLS